MSLQGSAFEEKMASIHFRRSANGLGMECHVAGVKIVAVESPLGIHLHFTRFTSRTATQFEVTAHASSTAQQIAALIVANIESAFPDVAKAGESEAAR